MKYRVQWSKWPVLIVSFLTTGLQAQPVKTSPVPLTPASLSKISTWYNNYYQPASEGRVNLAERAVNKRDSLRIAEMRPSLDEVGRPVYVYCGNGFDQVGWIDNKGNPLGSTTTSTYYANNLPTRFITKDSFNPWGSADVGTALIYGGLNYALNGFKTPNYWTQSSYVEPFYLPFPVPFR